ncbi:hypothetical protein NEOKW01_0644 [Nematocida sp. AWRm80]|nr:hypothetical protein NEOKW01_0644 [Nematocida sp. AWRm80]
MGRQKRIIDKEWENKSISQYEHNQKISSIIDDVFDNHHDSDEYLLYKEELEGLESNIYKEEKKKERKTVNRRVVNRPASQPYIKSVNNENRLCFKYPTKACGAEMMDKGFEEIEFSIKYDIENVDLEKMTEKFKMDNSIYPRANVPIDAYTGNRWEYETEVNKLAWKLTALNPALLYGKKGIVQRAVDSYRNLNKSTSSRRVVRMKKMTDGTLRKRQADTQTFDTDTTVLTWSQKGITKKCRIRIDIETIDYDKIDSEFKITYSVFSGEFDDQSFGLGKWENMNEDNVLAVKLAFLNVENTLFWNAVKVTDKVTMLRKAVEAYKSKNPRAETGIEMDLTEMHQEGLYFIDTPELDYREKPFYYL